MIVGRIRPNGLPIIPVEIAGQVYDAVLDTGFEGSFELPVLFYPLLNPILVGTTKFGLGAGAIEEVET